MVKVNVLYAFDTKFWKLAAVSMYSLLKNASSETSCTIHCMVPKHTKGKRKIRKIIKLYPNASLVWKTVRKKDNPYKSYDFSRWSPVIFYRLFAHNVFPDLDKVLYIDSDTLICSDLSDLYAEDVSKYVMGAVLDMAPTEDLENNNGKYVKEFSKKYLNDGPYYNSGVLLLNMEEMRKQGDLIKGVKVPLKYPDQDLLNVAFMGKIKPLKLKYNFGPGVRISKKFAKNQAKEVEKGGYKILHFYTIKPYWYSYACSNEYYSIFYKYANEIDIYPSDFLLKPKKVKQDVKTVFPFIKIKKSRITLFGITVKRF